MRRKDRQVIDPAEIEGMMARCQICHLGLVDHGRAYIVPMNFAFEKIGEQFSLIFHCAQEGRKLDLLRQATCVTFEMETMACVRATEKACTAYYESVMGNGTIAFITEEGEKLRALNLLMAHYHTQARPLHLEVVRRTIVFRLNIQSLTGKHHLT